MMTDSVVQAKYLFRPTEGLERRERKGLGIQFHCAGL